jgi:MtaA/CmuA family methyltransferase
MTGKQVILNALRGRLTERPAWLPFVGVHGAKIIGEKASDYLKSADLIVKGLTRARELYQPDGLPVAFDLQLEAEVLGCDLHWSDDGPPSVTSHPLSMGKELDDLPEFDPAAGRMPIVLDAARRLKKEFGDEVALYGLITGPFTLALHLLGHDIFLQMFDQSYKVKTLMQYCSEVARKSADAYLDAGVDVIAVVDPMTSQISPEHFLEFVTPALNPVFGHIRDRGALSSLFVCGDATRNLDVMSRTHTDNMSIDENISLESVRDLTRQYSKSFGGNMRLTTVLLMGKPDDARLDAIRCIDIGGRCGFILAPGCDLPYATPEENLQAAAEMVHDDYKRQVARTTITADSAIHADDVELPDYTDPATVVMDVVTLDSASCAPCQYMVGVANQVAKEVDVKVEVHEHKITTREGVGFMVKLGVQNIPTICIDGDVAFASLTPSTRELAGRIIERAKAKGAAGA